MSIAHHRGHQHGAWDEIRSAIKEEAYSAAACSLSMSPWNHSCEDGSEGLPGLTDWFSMIGKFSIGYLKCSINLARMRKARGSREGRGAVRLGRQNMLLRSTKVQSNRPVCPGDQRSALGARDTPLTTLTPWRLLRRSTAGRAYPLHIMACKRPWHAKTEVPLLADLQE